MKLNYEDYARLTPIDSGNYELQNGVIIYIPTPNIKHRDICLNIFSEIKFYLKNNKIGKVYSAPLDVSLTEYDTFQPDVLFVKQERLEQLEAAEKRIVGAPDFVVEVKSPSNSTKEMSYKRFVYESEIVHEYWYVNLEEQTVKQYENIDSEMRLTNTFKIGDSINSTVIKGFTVALTDIFKAD